MNTTTFMILYIFTFIMVALLMIMPIVLIVVVILHIKKKNRKHELEMYEIASKRQQEHEQHIQEEINLKKMKYKRVKCEYCGSLNKLDEATCINCGAPISQS